MQLAKIITQLNYKQFKKYVKLKTEINATNKTLVIEKSYRGCKDRGHCIFFYKILATTYFLRLNIEREKNSSWPVFQSQFDE